MTALKTLVLGLAAMSSIQTAEAAVHRVNCAGGPYTDIQSAVTAAAPGDTVVISPCSAGPYAPFQVNLKDNLQIVGANPQYPGEVGAVTAGTGISPMTYRPQVVVDGSLDPTTSCVEITNSSAVTVQQLNLQNCGVHGAYVVSSANVYLQGNRITGAAQDGVRIADVQGSVHVINNLIGRSNRNGLFGREMFESIITDNMIGRNGGAGILVPTTLSGDNQYFNNTIMGNGAACIEVGGTNEKVIRNTCLNNTGSFGGAEIEIGPTATLTSVIGNDTGGATSINDASGVADVANNR